jgi:4-hydroxy-3-methylbut-2-enyl diphosphate reductase
MFDLKVAIDKNSGFCFGVIYAIDMAEDLLAEQGYLYCLGDIVHNDEEVSRLKQKGLLIINHQDFGTLQNETVLIRAHGEPPSTYQTALENNIRLIDASCPVVLKLQNRIKRSYEAAKPFTFLVKRGMPRLLALKGKLTVMR